MKKIIVVMSICFLFTIQTFARGFLPSVRKENKYHISLLGGITNTNLTSKSSFPTFGPYDNSKIGLLFGGTIEKDLCNIISLEIGLFYIQSGGSSDTQTGTDEHGNELGDFHFIQDLHYLEIPFSLKMKF